MTSLVMQEVVVALLTTEQGNALTYVSWGEETGWLGGRGGKMIVDGGGKVIMGSIG